MIDKEQIIIDGVDVSKCKYFEDGECGCEYYLRYGYEITMHDRCEECPNCYFKQLARKTQECEELKEKIKIYSEAFDNPEFRVALTDIQTGERDIRMQRDERLTKENERYRKALEEIEEVAKDITEKDCYENSDAKASKILDIISKAKEEIVAYRRLTDLRLVKEYCCKPEGIKCPIHNYCYNDEFQCRYWKQIFKRINEEGFVVRQGNHWYKDFRNEEQLLGIISKAKEEE